jgi:hypothetical protein
MWRRGLEANQPYNFELGVIFLRPKIESVQSVDMHVFTIVVVQSR